MVGTLRPVTGETFEWDDVKRQAAVLVAEGPTPIGELAEQLGVTRMSLWRWRKVPEFAEVVAEIEAMLAAEVQRFTIGRRHQRMAEKDRRWHRLRRIAEERGEWFAENRPNVPGGDTGYIVETYKVVGTGAFATPQPEYSVDVGLAKALNELEREASVEAGQRVERQEVEASIGADIGPPTVLRFESQGYRPTDPNRDLEEWVFIRETGEWVNKELHVWNDDYHGQGLDHPEWHGGDKPTSGTKAIASGESDPTGDEFRLDLFTHQLVDGTMTRPEYDERVAELEGDNGGR